MPIVDPTGKDGIGRGANGRIFLIACGDLTEACLGGDEDIIGKLEFGKIVDDCNPDGWLGDIEAMGDCGVDLFAVRLSVRYGVNGADEAFGRLIRTAEECDDCVGNSRVLRTEAHQIEDYAGAHGTYCIIALEKSDEGREDGVGDRKSVV